MHRIQYGWCLGLKIERLASENKTNRGNANIRMSKIENAGGTSIAGKRSSINAGYIRRCRWITEIIYFIMDAVVYIRLLIV